MFCKYCGTVVNLRDWECGMCGREITQRDKDHYFATVDAERARNRREERPKPEIQEP